MQGERLAGEVQWRWIERAEAIPVDTTDDGPWSCSEALALKLKIHAAALVIAHGLTPENVGGWIEGEIRRAQEQASGRRTFPRLSPAPTSGQGSA